MLLRLIQENMLEDQEFVVRQIKQKCMCTSLSLKAGHVWTESSAGESSCMEDTKRIRNGIQDYAAGVMNSDTTQLSKTLGKNE